MQLKHDTNQIIDFSKLTSNFLSPIIVLILHKLPEKTLQKEKKMSFLSPKFLRPRETFASPKFLTKSKRTYFKGAFIILIFTIIFVNRE